MRHPASCRAAHGGFTLIELMVALLLSLVLGVALLKMQGKLSQQTVRTADVGVRDTQARAAMDQITKDLSGAGFLFGGTQNFCSVLMTYNNAVAGYYMHHPADGLAAVTGATMMFAPSLTLNYPPAGSSIPSDVLVITGSQATTNFNDNTYPMQRVKINNTYTPMTTGVLPLESATGFTSGDIGILQVPVGGKRACLRVPLTMAANVVTSAGTLMPGAFYTGFSGQMLAAGFSDVLSNAAIQQAEAAMVDMGAPATPVQTTTAFYVDKGIGSFPVLMRATYSLLDDTLIGTPQPIAAGVISLQVRFGVDPGSTGAVTEYETAAKVTANKYWDFVRSIKIAMVTRTLSDDADLADVTTVTVADKLPAMSPDPFIDLTGLTETKRRYVVHKIEVASRNVLWK
jgi:type IV pilus assembly protein PilW